MIVIMLTVSIAVAYAQNDMVNATDADAADAVGDGTEEQFFVSDGLEFSVPVYDSISAIAEKTRKDKIIIRGSTTEGSTVRFFINNPSIPAQVLETGLFSVEADETGEFSATIKLIESVHLGKFGLNELIIRITKPDGSREEITKYLMIDLTPPRLHLKDIKDVLNSSKVMLEGYIDEEGTVRAVVDSKSPVAVAVSNKTFSQQIDIGADGNHTLDVIAADTAGNNATRHYDLRVDTNPCTITFENPEVFSEVQRFSIASISGKTSEPKCTVKIFNVGTGLNISADLLKTRGMELLMTEFEVGVGGIIVGRAKELNSGEDAKFSTQIALSQAPAQLTSTGQYYYGSTYSQQMPQQQMQTKNVIIFITEDEAGNVNVEQKVINFEPGSLQWKVGRIYTVPNTVYSNNLMAERSTGVDVSVMYDVFFYGGDAISNVVATSSLDGTRYDNKFVSVSETYSHYFEDENRLFVLTKLKVKPVAGDIKQLKEDLGGKEIGNTGTGLQIDFALDTVISYRMGTASPSEHVYLKHAVGVETPFDYTKFLTPEIINKTLGILDDWIEFLEKAVDIAEKATIATTVGCVAMTVYSWLAGGATPENEKRMYMVCDRVWCPTIPPDCEKVKKVTSVEGREYVYDEEKEKYYAPGDKEKEEPLELQPKPEDVAFRQEVDGMTTTYRWVPGSKARTLEGRPICAQGENAIEIRSVNESQVPIRFKSTVSRRGGARSTGTFQAGSRTPMTTEAGTLRYACTTLNQSAYAAASATSGSVGCYSEGPPGFHETKCWPADADALNDEGEVNPYDDVFLSLQCGCVSGVRGHLSNFLRVSEGMKKCLQQAMIGEVRGGYCERLFAQYVCDLITWAIKKFLTGKGFGSFSSGEGSTFRGNFKEVNERLQQRYGGLIMNRFGLSTDQLVHKACIAAITGDWSDLRDVFQRATRVPVAPVIGPMIPESRFNAWNPFTGEASINYYLTLGILSGGQRVTGTVKIVCDKREPGGEYCPPGAPVIIYEEGVFVETDSSIETNIFYTDEKARYWGNVAILDLTYQLGDQTKHKIKKEQIIRKSPMIAQCHFQVVPPGIMCETISGALQAVEYRSSALSPSGVSTYYPGNSVVVKSEVASMAPSIAGAEAGPQPDIYLVYSLTKPNNDAVTNKDDPNKLASWKIDLSGAKGIYVNNVHTFAEAVGVSGVAEQLVVEGEKVGLSTLGIDKSVVLQEGDEMTVKAENAVDYSDRKILLFSVADSDAFDCSQDGMDFRCTAKEQAVVNKITYSIEAVGEDDSVRMRIFAGPDVLETRVLPAPRKSRLTRQAPETDFPPGNYKLNLTLYHDVDQNGIIDNRDDLVPFGREQVQSKQLSFTFRDVPPKDCKENPKVEFVLPLKDSLITQDMKTFYTKNSEVVFTMWDDCKEIESAALYDQKSWLSATEAAREWNARPENADKQKKEPYEGYYINKLDRIEPDPVTGTYSFLGPQQLKYQYNSGDAFDLIIRAADAEGKTGEAAITVIKSGQESLVLGTPLELECQRKGGTCKPNCADDETDLGPCDGERCCK
ncbi:hypothetical protein GF371_02445 [Candidatus Woesearchaeota archaeon]|nr:hypothetical protein [Candidatus Woesearchaeota archaeon]